MDAAPAHAHARVAASESHPPAALQLSSSSVGTKRKAYFYVSVVQFRLAWSGIVLVTFCVWLFLTSYTALYSTIYALPNVEYLVASYQLLPTSEYPLVATAYGIMSVVFLWSLVSILKLSIQTGQLSFGTDESQTTGKSKSQSKSRTRSKIASVRIVRRRSRSLRHAFRRFMAYTGVHGDGFMVATIVRGAMQIAIQTLQAYDTGRYTGSLAVNGVFALLLLLNCFAMPVVQRVYRGNQAKERMVLLLVDLFVDVVLLLVPSTLVATYLRAFMGDELVMFQDTYGARALMELKLVLVESHFNLLTKFVPSLSLFFTVTSITDLLRRTPTGTTPVVSQRSLHFSSSMATSRRLLNGTGVSARVLINRVAALVTSAFSVDQKRKLEKWVGRLFMTWGIVVAVLYVLAHALPGTCQAGCQLVLYPWFAFSKCRCAVQEIDCHDRRIEGRATELVSIFRQLERTGLTTLIITHCTALEIPSELHWFDDLYALDIYNCSIASFDESATISSAFFHRLGSLYLTRTNLTEIPAALLGDSLPRTLLEVAIIKSNLHTIPNGLDVKWPHVRTLYLEHGRLHSFPTVLGRMRLDSLSLYNNSIASIPDTALATSAFNYLQLSSNPLETLPSTLGDTSRLYELVIQSTNIFAISGAWVDSVKLPTTTRLYALGSPLCGGVGDVKHVSLSSAPVDTATVSLSRAIAVRCAPRYGLYSDQVSYTYYPLDGKTVERVPQLKPG